MADIKSQNERVLAIMSDGFHHTPLEFAQLARPILRFSARIYDLKKEGYIFEREKRTSAGAKFYAYKLVT